MASAQQQRRENKTNEREVKVEEHKVPKLASHYEALVEISQSPGGDTATISSTTTKNTGGAAAGAPNVEEAPKVVRKMEITDPQAATEASRARHEEGGKGQYESISGKVAGDRAAGIMGAPIGQEKQRMEGIKQGKTEESTKQRFSREEGLKQGKTEEGQKQGKAGEAQKQGFSGEGLKQVRRGEAQKQGKQGSTYEIGKFQVEDEENKDQGSRIGPSLEEISGYRQMAQQNSVEAVRAAEERYSKAKDLAANAAQEAKESASHGIGAATTYAAHLGSKAKDQTLGGIQYVSEKAAPAKETVVETAQRGYVATKDTVAGAGQTAADYTKTAAQKAGETGKTVAEKAAETGKTVGTKAVETGKTVAEKAVETGKTVGTKAVEVAAEVKDRAVVAGWGTAEYAGGLAVGATKAAAGVVKGVAGYTADTAAVAKDVVVDMGRRTGGYVEGTAVSAGETVTDYAGKKKAAAKEELEAKKRQGQAPLTNLAAGVEETAPTAREKRFSGDNKGSWEATEQLGGMVETVVDEGGGVLGAIGETIAEIAQGVVSPPQVAARVDPTLEEQERAGGFDKKSSKSRNV